VNTKQAEAILEFFKKSVPGTAGLSD